jgi:MarR family transcriptional regulator, lower aerobic nicotinate degradation pathway regulator
VHGLRKEDAAAAADQAFDLDSRPGFLIRRLHQIHVAIFLQECAEFQVTPVQYSLLTALKERGEMDQASLAAAIGIDRTTTANVLARLEKRGLLARAGDPQDLRVKICSLTRGGRQLLSRMEAAARRAHERTIDTLEPKDRRLLVTLLRELVTANNELGRAQFHLK